MFCSMWNKLGNGFDGFPGRLNHRRLRICASSSAVKAKLGGAAVGGPGRHRATCWEVYDVLVQSLVCGGLVH